MPPKKAAAVKRGRDEADSPAIKKAKTTSKIVAAPPVDEHFPKTGSESVYVDDSDNTVWAVKLNQTNIGNNNNKYYIIQLIGDAKGSKYSMFTRWGRVGEQGQKATETGSLQDMKKSFAKKFSDKTKNKWDDVKQDSSKFKFVSGKYDFIETDNTVSKEEAQRLAAAIANKEAAETPKEAENTKVVILPSELSSQVQHLMSLIMNKDTFKNQMKAQNIDADRMPLGKLTKAQVHKGYEALEKIENCLKSKKGAAELGQLCSAFYTIIPHDFGRSVPPLISDSTQLSKKYELLNMLNDIQIALEMEEAAKANKGKKKKPTKQKKTDVVEEENPLDLQYAELQCPLEVLSKDSEEYKTLETYIQKTKTTSKCQLLNIFSVDRAEDKKRMTSIHSAKENHDHHHLLFHGTNIAVIAAILKTGLRIMPHSGGRVGKGLYFASEINKSLSYCQVDHKSGVGYFFLVEVCMGDKVHEIANDDSSLNANKVHSQLACTSTLAQGRQDVRWDDKSVKKVPSEFQNGKKKIHVKIPQQPPEQRKQYEKSSFFQSEYLVYDEGKARIKYICEFMR